MKARVIALILTLVLVMHVLTACGAAFFAPAWPSMGGEDYEGDRAYEIMTETYTTYIYGPEDIIKIQYPQIRAAGDQSRESELNDMLKRHILEVAVQARIDAIEADAAAADAVGAFPYSNDGVYDLKVVYHIMTQTDELLSVVYQSEDWYYATGRDPNNCRCSSHAWAITVDLVNMRRLALSDFTPIDQPEEAPGFDLHYRITQSRDILSCELHPDPGVLEEVYIASMLQVCTPHSFRDNYSFFIMPDALYYICESGLSGGGYLFVKILDEAGPYQLPAG